MDSGVLADLIEDAVQPRGIDSITIVRSGYVVLDAVFYPFPEDVAHVLHSATKSVTGTLIGMAIDRGLLTGVDVPVVELLPAAAPDDIDELKAASTVEHFLTMTHGLDCQDSSKYLWRGYRDMMESYDWVAHVLALPMRHEPGTYFEYGSGASVVLSAIVSEATGTSAAEFAREVLFGPLGITDVRWDTVPPGISNGEGGLYLRPHDMAKLGYLYLRGGEWDGQQIVPQHWEEAATRAHAQDPTSSDGYGYQWWIHDVGYGAVGLGGQWIRVIPEHDLVVVFTAGLSDMDRLARLTAEYVLPAIVSDAPLPADAESQEQLAAAVAGAAAGPEPEIVALPNVAFELDGVRFEARDNELGWKWFQVDLRGDAAILTGEGAEGQFEHTIGLDRRYRVDDDGLALRGAWLRDRFVVEIYVIGEAERSHLQWVYDGDRVRLHWREHLTGESATSIADRVD
jgi:CubicO group peptidase (beta-lactamase class C family)